MISGSSTGNVTEDGTLIANGTLTITDVDNSADEPLPGYTEAKPVVFSSMYPMSTEEYPELVKALEDEFGVTVTMDTYDSNEAMQPIVAAGNSGYSLIVPSDYMVAILIAGTALGLAYNWFGLQGSPRWGLAWIAEDKDHWRPNVINFTRFRAQVGQVEFARSQPLASLRAQRGPPPPEDDAEPLPWHPERPS